MRACAAVLVLTTGCGVSTTGAVDATTADGHTMDATASDLTADTTGPDDAAPVLVPLTDMAGIAAGYQFTCAWRVLSPGPVLCWGDGFAGMLGDGTHTARSWASPVQGLPSWTDSVSAGIVHACATDHDRHAWCWGDNGPGLLGDGTMLRRETPVALTGLDAVQRLGLTGGSGCATLGQRASDIACWGDGRLAGHGSPAGSPELVPTRLQGFHQVEVLATGTAHTCFSSLDGTVRCWGRNTHGQLGDGTTTDRDLPTAVVGLPDTLRIWAGSQSTCAQGVHRGVWCWGANSAGQLGDGTTRDQPVPVPFLGPTDIVTMALGETHGCALRTDGTVWCWGEDASGQLGDDGTFGRTTAAAVPGLTGVIALAAGAYHTCAVKSDGSVWCWGRGTYGQLGDNSREIRRHPVQVLRTPGDP